MAWRQGPAGIEDNGERTEGPPRNLGDPAVSAPIKSGLGEPEQILQARGRQCPGAHESETGTLERYR